MRTYKLTIAYDGTRYQGWQRQENTDRTIQGIMEQTIAGQTGFPVEVNGSGRTDAGVHAKGQTASVILPGQAANNFFTGRINAALPADIRITDARLVKNGFHARKSAVAKQYEYYIDTGEKPDVFTRKYMYHFPRKLDLERMRIAAGYLNDIIVSGQGSRVVLTFDGTGFLYHMVRILTGTLLETGTYQRTPESVRDALDTKDRSKAGFIAPARGLFLREVRYD